MAGLLLGDWELPSIRRSWLTYNKWPLPTPLLPLQALLHPLSSWACGEISCVSGKVCKSGLYSLTTEAAIKSFVIINNSSSRKGMLF